MWLVDIAYKCLECDLLLSISHIVIQHSHYPGIGHYTIHLVGMHMCEGVHVRLQLVGMYVCD